MENTLTLFEHQTDEKWFIVVDGRLLGPVSGKEVALWVTGGEVGIGSFVWQEGFPSWKRMYEIKDFQPLLPTEPDPVMMAKARSKLTAATTGSHAPQPPSLEQRIWFLYMNNAQYGPFATSELELMAEAGRIQANTYLWKKGMPDWELASTISQTPELKLKLTHSTTKKAKTTDKRNTPRKPFEAKILLTDGREVGWALCRDISIGGMQILMDHVPGEEGTILKLNVNASGDIPSFACEGEIVRVLEDGRGFSFRFTTLPEKAQTAIKKYLG